MLKVIEKSEYEFRSLCHVLHTDEWPQAAQHDIIIDPESEYEKIIRGKDIVNILVGNDVFSVNVLDFGCGEGYSAFFCADVAKYVVGYDRKFHDQWKSLQKENLLYTTSWADVINLRYEVILLFDVLDHLEDSNIVSVLSDVKKLLSPKGKLYIRVHPWCSRHAIHQYYSLNKAYLNLIFSKEELMRVCPVYMENTGLIKMPFKEYSDFFEECGLKIESMRAVRDNVEPIFQSSLFAKRIRHNYNIKDLPFPDFQMSVTFIDYILGLKK